MLERFQGTCEFLAYVNHDTLTETLEWLHSFPLSDWPQQGRYGEPIKPAMPTNLLWQGFGVGTQKLVDEVMSYFPGTYPMQRMMGCIMPGNDIQRHRDSQPPQWITRVHIPLTSNPKALFVMDDGPHHMDVGKCYRVNTEAYHAIRNDGDCPRIHLMVDVHEGKGP